MIDYKKIISEEISNIIGIADIELNNEIEIPKNSQMGDFAFPCFKLAKELRKAPPIIAKEISEKINLSIYFEKVEVAGGYLNFFVNKEAFIKDVFEEVNERKNDYGKSNIGNGKNIIVEYSAPNIAKPFHIGHLRSTVIGAALYKIYKALGYNVTGINHLGDYGTQFGKMIEGYKRWAEEYNLEENPIEELTKMYVRINDLCKQDEEVLNICRDNFKKLEEGDSYCREVWQNLRTLSLKEFQKIYDLLNVKFDSLKGEAFYIDKMPEIVEKLEASGKLVESEGAKIVDLEHLNMAPCMVLKSNNSTTYATRDLAAIMYRARTYDFDKAIYVVAYEQNLHFKQVFEVAKYLGLDKKYTDGLIHVPFGMVRLKTGKMSTREGNIIKLENLLNDAISKAKEIIENKNPDLENKDEIAKKVGIGAVIFNDLANNRIKDEIFDLDEILNFQGETGPYIQYIYVRTNSILEKENFDMKIDEMNINELTDDDSFIVAKQIYEYGNIIKLAAEKNEPSIISRYLIELSQSFSNFYTKHKIIVEDEKVKNARLMLTYACHVILKNGCEILGIEMPEKM